MNATNNTSTAAASVITQTAASAQTGSIVLLSAAIALVRAALVIVAAVSLGASARFFFPEMFAVPSNPMTLLGVVAADTFVVVAGILLARAKAGSSPSKG